MDEKERDALSVEVGVSTIDLSPLMVCWPTSLSSSSVTVIILYSLLICQISLKFQIYWQRADLNIFLDF